MPDRRRLTDQEIADRLAALPGWTVVDGRLHRAFKFAGFVEAFGFMSSVAQIAERMDHHPDWSNVYDTVVVDLATHDAGGITELDFALAERMGRLVD